VTAVTVRGSPVSFDDRRAPVGLSRCAYKTHELRVPRSTRVYDGTTGLISLRRHHESSVPAARANHCHRYERLWVSGVFVLLRRRAVCNASGRMYEGADTTRFRAARATPTTEIEARMTPAISVLPVYRVAVLTETKAVLLSAFANCQNILHGRNARNSLCY
jgi:hypothetical protein